MLKRRYLEDDEKTDRWLISYADFITLLLAFFVVMYSISSVNDEKYRMLSQAFMTAFEKPERSLQVIQQGDINRTDNMVQGDNLDPVGAELDGNTQFDLTGGDTEEAKEQRLALINQKLQSNLAELINNDLVNLNLKNDWLLITIKSGLLFRSGSNKLVDSAKPVIESVSQTLNDTQNEIRVRGYTDNVPIDSEYFESNWTLSSARAIAVMNLMFDNGISPYQVVAEGYGEFSPIADNNTKEGRAKNRRVVIAVSKNRGRVPIVSFTGGEIEQPVDEGVNTELNNQETTNTVEQPVVKEPEVELEITRLADGTLRIRAKEPEVKKEDGSQ